MNMVGCGSHVTKYIHRIKAKAEGYVDIEAEEQHFG